MLPPNNIFAQLVLSRMAHLLVNPQAAGGVWNFSATLPLSAVFSFCNDYRKVIYGMQHKISLTRTNNTRALLRTDAAVAASGIYPALDAIANDVVVNITTLKWVMSSVTPSVSYTHLTLPTKRIV